MVYDIGTAGLERFILALGSILLGLIGITIGVASIVNRGPLAQRRLKSGERSSRGKGLFSVNDA